MSIAVELGSAVNERRRFTIDIDRLNVHPVGRCEAVPSRVEIHTRYLVRDGNNGGRRSWKRNVAIKTQLLFYVKH